ncbi:RsmB/NOP family class I SAM-dependent RNA methyltransferase [Paenibacillus alkaliterrae]|uniref:RsmB/NOP family class I SAM-dependent RNA methyltransferase n=1 Tax=Paenibacillus alkaliterrae TaxID=320909 RepID=UPI001F36BCE7|nr:RsmB/NOP family class I SAM-dependent RNA methyltransferase [Paenibacillus alkaliterrae]MCF2938813.1 RsmB/NOP family class I SAM-dependent RNA methyltransferase [Paenibacillus alkaliterrae]
MIGNLPLNFTAKMEKLLGEEFDDFMSSYAAPRVYGLRINRLKLNMEEWKGMSPLSADVSPIPWAEDGLYYKEGERPGKHPHYHAGLYYIQEPSAMAPVELLDVRPGQRVLDLCAAPGGKSTQIAAKLQGGGVLVTNDNARERTKALAKNIELAGVRNAVVMNEEPAALAPVFTEWFDRILIDAPCSGEGMFRKDESMIAEWEKHSVERCSLMQCDILRHAASMLAPGGLMVYSTCTFSPEENEQQIASFLSGHTDFQVVPIVHGFGWNAGRPDLIAKATQLDGARLQSIEGTVRLWPHRIEGEGHYAAVLRRDGANTDINHLLESAVSEEEPAKARHAGAAISIRRSNEKRYDQREERRAAKLQTKKEWQNAGLKQSASKKEYKTRSVLDEEQPIDLWRQQAEHFAYGALAWTGQVVAYGSRVYIQPNNMPSLDGLRVVRAGWYVGEAGRGRIEPSHPLAMGLKREEAVRSVNWSSNDPQTLRYLRGETLFVEESEIVIKDGAAAKGYVLICTDGHPIGWGKYAEGMIKNELPAGWRWI